MKRQFPRFTWIEYLVALGCLLFVLRVLFGGVARAWEEQLLNALGLHGNEKVIVGLPTVALVLYWRFRRGKWSAQSEAGAVPSWLAAVDTLVILLGAGAVVWMAVA